MTGTMIIILCAYKTQTPDVRKIGENCDMLINTRQGWKLIFDAVHRSFENTLTTRQKTAFSAYCAKRFPRGYEMKTDSMGDTQTAVKLMLEFCKQIDVEEWEW